MIDEAPRFCNEGKGNSKMFRRLSRYRIPALMTAVLGLTSMCFKFHWHTSQIAKDRISDVSISTPTKENQTLDLACLFPDTDPFNPAIRKIYKTAKSLKCTGAPALTYVINRGIFVKKSRVAALNSGTFKMCTYREIFRTDSENSVTFSDWKQKFTDNITVNEKVEFVHVVCTKRNGKRISSAYYPFFLNDKNVEINLDIKLKKRNVTKSPDETLNVIMVGLDGTSRNQIIRDLPQTYKFLTKKLQAFDMEMYSQVGGDTFSNFVALLAGESESEVRRWWKNSDPANHFDLIWDKFKQSGYRTLFTEDQPRGGGFHYLKKGFLEKPVQYYHRPLTVAFEKDMSVMNNKGLCFGNVPEIIAHMNDVYDFANTYRKKPYFAFLFNTRVTHDDDRRAGMIDEHLHASLERFSKDELLNNTLLFFFTDHGPRWGKIRKTFHGSIEGRSPIGLFAFPQWFVQKYPDIFNSFRMNTKRLTTHFDTHATLLDIIDFKSKGPRVSTRYGRSLFQEISPSRTCKTAFIPDEFCLCGESDKNVISVNSSLASKLGAAVLKTINGKRNKEKCTELFVDKILSVYQLNLKHEVTQYKVTLQTKPGAAQYQATVSETVKNSELSVGSKIPRVNMYRGTAECVDDALVRPFCYCLNLIERNKQKKG